jgi:ubiquinone/menaquinone biosynthesis C-methylase UbiE
MDLHERFSALIHPSRTRIFRLLNQEELSGGEVTRITQGAQSTTSRHLKQLTESGWVVNRRMGNTILFSASKMLTQSDLALWHALEIELQDRWPDDEIRLATTLSERSPNSRDYFGRLGARWEEIRHILYGDHSLTHLAFSMLPRAQVVADLGCGSGTVLSLLASQVDWVIGVDREPAMIEAAHNKVAQFENVEIRHGELESPPLDHNELDLALLNLVLHLVDSPVQVLRAAGKALKTNGRIIMIDMVAHNREDYRQSMGHVSLGFSREQLVQIAESAHLKLQSYQPLPPDLKASGPALFSAIFSR